MIVNVVTLKVRSQTWAEYDLLVLYIRLLC